jgi:translation initiation factor 2B subunit (eIF-2B alpha/beta/delta family)
MDPSVAAAVDRLREDATSGASELLPHAIEILRGTGDLLPDAALDVARAVGQAQPSMASLWNAALAALGERRRPGLLARFDERRRRAPDALVRCALDQLLLPGAGPLHVVTISFSGSVVACLRAAARRVRLRVSCAEGRPGLEGRRMARALAESGIAVDLRGDAALGDALGQDAESETIVLVGADAVTPGWMLNKTGTSMLAAAAARLGVPIYVVAARDKFMDPRAARLLRIVEHDPRAVWDEAPAGVVVRNAWFERVPGDLLTGVITEAGTLSPDMLEEACRAASADVADEDIASLLGE